MSKPAAVALDVVSPAIIPHRASLLQVAVMMIICLFIGFVSKWKYSFLLRASKAQIMGDQGAQIIDK